MTGDFLRWRAADRVCHAMPFEGKGTHQKVAGKAAEGVLRHLARHFLPEIEQEAAHLGSETPPAGLRVRAGETKQLVELRVTGGEGGLIAAEEKRGLIRWQPCRLLSPWWSGSELSRIWFHGDFRKLFTAGPYSGLLEIPGIPRLATPCFGSGPQTQPGCKNLL